MRKVIVLVLVLFGISSVYAAESGLEADAGTTPDSITYFIDRMMENVQMFFTFGHEAKARRHAMYAEERIAEMEKMVDVGRTKHMQGLVDNYEKHMESSMMEIAKAESKGKNETAMMHSMAKRSSMDMHALQKMHDRAPEVQETLEAAMNTSMRGYMVSMAAMAGGHMGDMMQKSIGELNKTMMSGQGMSMMQVPMGNMMQKSMGNMMQGSSGDDELNKTTTGQDNMPMQAPMMGETSVPEKQSQAKGEPAIPMTGKSMH